MTDPRTLEPIEPNRAFDLYLSQKATECAETTVQAHEYRLGHFVRWYGETDRNNLNTLSGRDLHEYRSWRQEDGDLNTVSLHTQLSTLRVFLKWAATIEAVDPNLYEKVPVPQLNRGEDRRSKKLDADEAERLLGYLDRFEYASRDHVVLALLWESAMRIGGVHSIDLKDFHQEDAYIEVHHRPATGTVLKNGNEGERLVALSPNLCEIIGDYIDHQRPDVTDGYGRQPLFTSRSGRLSKNALRNTVYRVTAPCYVGDDCPGCERDNRDRKCPEAINPHAVRRGAITAHLTSDVPTDMVGDRADVSRDVMAAHYDGRSEFEKRNSGETTSTTSDRRQSVRSGPL